MAKHAIVMWWQKWQKMVSFVPWFFVNESFEAVWTHQCLNIVMNAKFVHCCTPICSQGYGLPHSAIFTTFWKWWHWSSSVMPWAHRVTVSRAPLKQAVSSALVRAVSDRKTPIGWQNMPLWCNGKNGRKWWVLFRYFFVLNQSFKAVWTYQWLNTIMNEKICLLFTNLLSWLRSPMCSHFHHFLEVMMWIIQCDALRLFWCSFKGTIETSGEFCIGWSWVLLIYSHWMVKHDVLIFSMCTSSSQKISKIS